MPAGIRFCGRVDGYLPVSMMGSVRDRDYQRSGRGIGRLDRIARKRRLPRAPSGLLLSFPSGSASRIGSLFDKGFCMPRKRGIDAYFRFLNLAKAVQALPSVPQLDFAEERLLEALSASWHAGRPLTVTETMALSVAGAPATVHRKLTSLKMQGLVSVDESAEDLRIKTVVPTRKALDYFEKLASCLEEAKRH